MSETTETSILKEAALVAAELIWPTRCCICAEPGELLCRSCKLKLNYIDQNRACPVCGAPFGSKQCSECNAVTLAAKDRVDLPFDKAVSALVFDDFSRRIVLTYKDKGERRLSHEMGMLASALVAPEWKEGDAAITFVPSSPAALRKRGFDQAQRFAQETAASAGLPCVALLSLPHHKDQRTLARNERLNNTSERFSAIPGASIPQTVIVVDDVMTTGATLFAACEALKAAGAHHLYCATFARVW